ncbi:MAG: flippase [Longimicrobiales bacterium]
MSGPRTAAPGSPLAETSALASASPTSSGLVARNFAALGSGEVIARAIAFAATLYIARALGPAAYGVIGFAAAVTLYFSRIADCGIDLGLGIREIAHDRPRALSGAPTVLTARLLIAALLALGFAAAGTWLLPPPEGTVLAAYGLTLLTVAASVRWIHLGFERTRQVAVARAAGEIVMVALVFAFVRGADDLVRVPLAQFAGDALAVALLLLWLPRPRPPLRPRLDAAVIGPLLPRAWPIVSSGLLGLMIYNSDLIFLRLFHTAELVGYYAAAYALISFLANLGMAYGVSLLPTLTRLGRSPDEQRELYQTAMAQVCAVVLPVAVGGAFLAHQIIGLIFGAGYAPSGIALQVLIWSIPLALVRDVPVAALFAAGRETQVFRLTGVAAVLNVGLNILLIPRYGMLGAAAATVFTEGVRLLIALRYAAAAGFVPASPRRLLPLLLAASAMAAVLALASGVGLYLGVLVGGFSYLVALFCLGAIQLGGRTLPALRV